MLGWIVVAAWAGDPEELLHLARERARHGDFEGVRIVAHQALEIDGDHQRTAQYLIAMSWELGGDPEQALAIYDSLEAAWTPSTVPDDLRFRRAECLGRLGRYDEAVDELRALPKADRPPLDQLKIDVLFGTWDLELGHERRAWRRLERTLAEAEPGGGTYYQAVARYALLEHAVEEANLLLFVGSDRGKLRAIERRAELIEVGNAQLAEIIRTEETWFALNGFVLLARAHERLGHELLDEAPPIAEKAEGIWLKARRYYDRGIQLAAHDDWTGPPLPTLKAEYDALLAQIERL